MPHSHKPVHGMLAEGMSHDCRLEDLGTAEQAGQRFLTTTVAPEGSGREANLLAASTRCAACSPIYQEPTRRKDACCSVTMAGADI
jgi:PsbP